MRQVPQLKCHSSIIRPASMPMDVSRGSLKRLARGPVYQASPILSHILLYMHHGACVSVPCVHHVVDREKDDDCAKDDNRPEQKGLSATYLRLTLFELAAYQFMDVPVGFGALGKNWKIQATRRKDKAIILMTLPALPRLNRDEGKDSPRIRF